jgi:hypothetical protein
MASLDEKEAATSESYPNKWMYDLIRDQITEESKAKVEYFYRSKIIPTVLVGKQRHKLPFCRLNFSSRFFADLAASGQDDPETLFEGGDVTLDALFIATWTALNLDLFPLIESDYKTFLECDYDTPLDLAEFLRFSNSPQLDQWLHWYCGLRPVARPEERYTLCDLTTIEWWAISPQGRKINVAEFGSDFPDDVKDRNVLDEANVTFSKCLKEGWKFFVEISHSSIYKDPSPFLAVLSEIYSTTSKRSAEEMMNSLTWVEKDKYSF